MHLLTHIRIKRHMTSYTLAFSPVSEGSTPASVMDVYMRLGAGVVGVDVPLGEVRVVYYITGTNPRKVVTKPERAQVRRPK